MQDFLQRLQKLLEYDHKTGKFYWSKFHKTKAGRLAGTLRPDGRMQISFERKLYLAYRLAWLMHYGQWPKNHIDHIDGNRSNNRIENLRDVDRATNIQNQRKAHKDKSTTFLGVRQISKKWNARIYVSGRNLYLGSFDSPKEASEAYIKAKRIYHKGCTI